MITPEDLATLPENDRRTIALWLVERSETFVASMFLTEEAATTIRRALVGAAVDLTDPLSDDTTIGHATHVLGMLTDNTDRECPSCGHWPWPGRHGETGCGAGANTPCGCTHTA